MVKEKETCSDTIIKLQEELTFTTQSAKVELANTKEAAKVELANTKEAVKVELANMKEAVEAKAAPTPINVSVLLGGNTKRASIAKKTTASNKQGIARILRWMTDSMTRIAQIGHEMTSGQIESTTLLEYASYSLGVIPRKVSTQRRTAKELNLFLGLPTSQTSRFSMKVQADNTKALKRVKIWLSSIVKHIAQMVTIVDSTKGSNDKPNAADTVRAKSFRADVDFTTGVAATYQKGENVWVYRRNTKSWKAATVVDTRKVISDGSYIVALEDGHTIEGYDQTLAHRVETQTPNIPAWKALLASVTRKLKIEPITPNTSLDT